jgi:hypothetical protein
MFSNSAMLTSAHFYAAATTGDAVKLSGALPAPLSAGTTYYAIKVGGNQIQFASTRADATANPPFILGFYNIIAGAIRIRDITANIATGGIIQTDFLRNFR